MSKDDLKELNDGLKAAGLDSLAQDSTFTKVISGSAHDSTEANVEWRDSSKEKKKKNSGISFSGPSYMTVKEYDSVQNLLPEEKRDGWLARKLNIRSIELNNRYKDDDGNKAFSKDFGHAFLDNFSKVLFYLLPIFALLLRLFYIRRDFFYSEHLVFSIYYYNFFYLAGSLILLINLIPWLNWLSILVGFWIFFYLLFAMKRMYNQSWRKTILKFVLFSFTFMFFLSLGLSISAMVVLMMI